MWPKSYSSGWTSTEWVDRWKLPGNFLISNLHQRCGMWTQSCDSPGLEQASLLVDAQWCFHSVFYHPYFMPSLIILGVWNYEFWLRYIVCTLRKKIMYLNVNSEKLALHPRNAHINSDRNPRVCRGYNICAVHSLWEIWMHLAKHLCLIISHFSVGSLFATRSSDLTSGLTK